MIVVDDSTLAIISQMNEEYNLYYLSTSGELKTLIEEALESESRVSDVKHRITSLSEKIDDNDNPILVIGKLTR